MTFILKVERTFGKVCFKKSNCKIISTKTLRLMIYLFSNKLYAVSQRY